MKKSLQVTLFVGLGFVLRAQDSLSLKSIENILDKVVVIESSELKHSGTDM